MPNIPAANRWASLALTPTYAAALLLRLEERASWLYSSFRLHAHHPQSRPLPRQLAQQLSEGLQVGMPR